MQLFAIQNLDFKINNQYNVSLKKDKNRLPSSQ